MAATDNGRRLGGAAHGAQRAFDTGPLRAELSPDACTIIGLGTPLLLNAPN